MLQPEQILHDRYQLRQLLGQNAGRQTWLADDLAIEAHPSVIVKLLIFGDQVQWDTLKLFEREATILKQLQHPQVPNYRDYFAVDDRLLWFGLVQEHIPGSSFKELLSQGKRFSESEVRSIATQLLQVLIYLHGLNPPVLHRDIKPSNLIWGEDEQVHLIDFGAVQDRATVEGSTFTVVGTYGYAPIEQFGGRTVPASDLYALGATLIHLVTGVAPADLPQRNMQIHFADRVSLSPQLVAWLQHLTDPQVDKRPQTAQAALELLNRPLQDSQTTAILPNTSGQGLHSLAPVPEEILGWNWGAFLLPNFWIFTNRVWLGLITWVPVIGSIMALTLGAKGNEWAWKSRRWRSIKHFKDHQRGWAIAGVCFGLFTWWPYALFLSQALTHPPTVIGLTVLACVIAGIMAQMSRSHRKP